MISKVYKLANYNLNGLTQFVYLVYVDEIYSVSGVGG